jgi:uncharacterized lipoprotein YmbA
MTRTGEMLRRCGSVAIIGIAVASCASPPITLYALGASGGGTSDGDGASRLRPGLSVIEVARVTLPDYLDSQDILVRRGSVLATSHSGRWASRLSLGATDLLAARLARTRPGALVTGQPQTDTPNSRLVVNISRLDVAEETAGVGRATLDADWSIVPRDAKLPTLRDRVSLESAGAVGFDQSVVSLETALLSRLADAIDITRLR